jgi:TRAP-type C4-dicarboxylate transport system permease small subunit
MEFLYRFCLWTAGLCIVFITAIVPWGVFTRYVLGYGSNWPEPLAILLMIVFSMLSAAVCYRDGLHIAIMALPDSLPKGARRALGWIVEFCMLGAGAFMVVWGEELVKTTWPQTIAEFPALSTGITYLPIPIGGVILLLFVIERLWTGNVFVAPTTGSIAAPSE